MGTAEVEYSSDESLISEYFLKFQRHNRMESHYKRHNTCTIFLQNLKICALLRRCHELHVHTLKHFSIFGHQQLIFKTPYMCSNSVWLQEIIRQL